MALHETLPSYDSLPPTYTISTSSFVIGTTATEKPLVSPEQLKDHLALLRKFHALRLSVEGSEEVKIDNRIPEWALCLDKEVRWFWFVDLAVERFKMWCKALPLNTSTEFDKFAPPIDVFMVWHSYILNPLLYAKDCDRLPLLAGLKKFDAGRGINVAAVVNLLGGRPSLSRIEFWKGCTLTAFDPMDALAKAEYRDTIQRPSGPFASVGSEDRPFSIELTGAVLRQGSFIKQMVSLQWTEPSFFETEHNWLSLERTVAKYHAFLDLISSIDKFTVPTVDIDLAWHTHQLSSSRYNNDCMKYMGRHLDHKNYVDAETLASSFDVTRRAWQSRFNVPYVFTAGDGLLSECGGCGGGGGTND